MPPDIMILADFDPHGQSIVLGSVNFKMKMRLASAAIFGNQTIAAIFQEFANFFTAFSVSRVDLDKNISWSKIFHAQENLQTGAFNVNFDNIGWFNCFLIN